MAQKIFSDIINALPVRSIYWQKHKTYQPKADPLIEPEDFLESERPRAGNLKSKI